MGYYANGSGSITFERELKTDEQEQIAAILEDEWFEFDFFLPAGAKESKNPHNPIGVDLWQDDKYHGDRVEFALAKISALVPVKQGCIEYAGEDAEHWRFIYKPLDNRWHEQEGRIVYDEDD